MSKAMIEKIYSLSPMQEGMLFHSLQQDQQAYFEQVSIKLKGKLNVDTLEKSYNKLIERYDIFRTTFLYKKISSPKQVVLDVRKMKLEFENLKDMGSEEQVIYIRQFMDRDKKKGFDLSKDILMRIKVFQTGFEDYKVVWSYHHILMDGWCLGLLIKDLFYFYECIEKSLDISLGPTSPYINFIKWIEEQDRDKAIAYWSKYLDNLSEETKLPWKSNIAKNETKYQVRVNEYTIEQSFTEAITKTAKEYQVTTNVIFQAAYAILLQRYNNTNDVVFGAVVSGRPSTLQGINEMVGLFINTIPVRIKSCGEESVSILFKKLHENLRLAEEYSYLPLADIQQQSDLKRNLINQIFVFENYPISRGDNYSLGIDLKIDQVYVSEQTNYDFNMIILPGTSTKIKIIFNENMYNNGVINQIIEHYLEILKQLVMTPKKNICDVSVLSKDAEEKILRTFNNPITKLSTKCNIIQLFQEKVWNNKQKKAVIYKSKEMSYELLNREANQLARLLKEIGINRQEVVGIYLDYSPKMVVSILAVLKIGAIYLPLDPKAPVSRTQYMLLDCKAKAILTNNKYIDEINENMEFDFLVYSLDTLKMLELDHSNLDFDITSDDLAYIMYTSGSTGEPKGVMVSHKNVLRLTVNSNFTKWRDKDKLLLTGAIGFDATTFEIFGTLLNGVELHLVDKEIILNPIHLNKYVNEQQITTMWLTSSLFNQLFDEKAEIFQNLKNLFIGGDKLSTKHVNALINKYKQIKVINGYGPTENTTFSTTFVIDRCYEDNIPIGRPISHTTAYILDQYNHLMPIGIIGELCVGGEGVAKGYLNKPEMTSKKFVSNPFMPGEIMYKTGDLAYWDKEGIIHYVGRLDNQVKIYGHRVEVSEIENFIKQHPLVKEATVIVKKKGNTVYLHVYYVSSQQKDIELKEYVGAFLPSYMVPKYYKRMDALPLNSNGKIDENALPEQHMIEELSSYHISPRNEIEEQLTNIWKSVLEVENISINDNFFDIGGHSLKTIMISSRIYKEMNVDVTMSNIFEFPTIKELARHIAGKERKEFNTIQPALISSSYPISSAQRRMFISHKLEGESKGIAYNIPGAFLMEGRLDITKFKKSIEKLIERHESLRTSFDIIDGKHVQIIHPNVQPLIQIFQKKIENDLENSIRQFIRPFQLDKAPLFRVALIKLKENKHIVLYDMHHIISDGTSMKVIIDDFFALYRGQSLSKLEIQYKDYTMWYQTEKQTVTYKEKENFWLSQFQKEMTQLQLPTDFSRPKIRTFKGQEIRAEINQAILKRLKKLMKASGSTLFMVLLATFNVVLKKYTDQEDIIIGTPVTGRVHPELEKIVGMFVNTLPLRNFPVSNKSFYDFLLEVKRNTIKAFENQDYSIDELLEKLNINKMSNRNPLFDTLLVVENIDLQLPELRDFHVQSIKLKNLVSKFDLTFTFFEDESKSSLSLIIEYSEDLFKKETVKRMSKHFTTILNQVSLYPTLTIAEIELLSSEEKKQIIDIFNNTKAVYPKNKSIPKLFDEVVMKNPNKIAICHGDEKVTYFELNKIVNVLARDLLQRGITKEEVVGILIDKSINLIASLLAVLKVGAAYLSIDKNYPNERIRYMLEDSQVAFVLTDDNKFKFLSNLQAIKVSEILRQYNESNKNLEDHQQIYKEIESNQLAYVMYTSGSTGLPKGVMVEHKSIIRLVQNNDFISWKNHDRLLQTGALGFDATIFEIFGSLLNGIEMHLVENDIILQPGKLKKYAEKNEITIMWLTSSLFNLMMEEEPGLCNILEQLIIGGETVSPKHVSIAKKANPNLNLINGYGPTENTTFSTTYSIPTEIENIIPIGKPIKNSIIYVIGADYQLQPIGVPGELFVGGDGLARGYINNKGLTKDRFLEIPAIPSAKLYKTGDLGVWLPDGNIKYLGRLDNQVKIRGNRIELGEIESSLMSHEAIKEVVVTLYQNDEDQKLLVAYYTATYLLREVDLRKYMSEKVPDYMIPSYFIEVSFFPLTQNGKIDYRRLPKPKALAVHEYELPRTELEGLLCSIWADVLSNQKVGIKDNFFELGGDSIKASQIISRLSTYGYTVELREVFQNPTIEQLCTYVKKTTRLIDQGIVEGNVPLLPIQHWFFDSAITPKNHFNHSVLLYGKKGFKAEYINSSLEKIIEHHDALRMVYRRIDGKIQQVNKGLERNHTLVIEDLSKDALYEKIIEERLNKLQRSIDLKKGPLVKVGLFHTKEGDYLGIVIHHLVVDGISWRILFEDLAIAYNQLENQLPIQLEPKTDSYQYWAKKIVEYEKTPLVQNELDYWLSIENMKIPPLPKDNASLTNLEKDAAIIEFTLDNTTTNRLLSVVHQAYDTEVYEALLAALALSISRWAFTDQVLITMEGHGRETIDEELNITRTIGWFTTMFPLLLQVNDKNKENISDVIQMTKEKVRSVPHKGFHYGILKYLSNHKHQFKLIPDITFNYLGQFDRDIENHLFHVSELSMGNNIDTDSSRTSKIDVIGIIFNGRLKIDIRYNSLEYRRQTIQVLANQFKENLKLIVKQSMHKLQVEDRKNQLKIDSVEELSTKIKNKYHCDTLFHYYYEADKRKLVLFISDPTIDMDNLKQYIREYAEEELMPNYIKLFEQMVSRDYTNENEELLRFKEVTEKDLKQISYHLNKQVASFDKGFKRIVVKQYPFSGIQAYHIKNTQFTGVTIDFEEDLNIDKLEQSLLETINKHTLLKSVATKKNRLFMWKEIEPPIEMDIPIIDISEYNPSSKETIISHLMSKAFYYKKYEQFDKLLYRPVLVKIDNKNYKLIIAFDHAIFDAMSGEIFKTSILNYYNSPKPHLTNIDIPTSYDHYVEQVAKGPLGVTDQQLVRVLKLDSMDEYLETIGSFVQNKKNQFINRDRKLSQQREENSNSTWFRYEYVSQDEVDMDICWKISLKMLRKICKNYLGINKVPISLINYGRRYEYSSYFNTVGDFVDIVPLIISDNDQDSEMISKIQNVLNYVSDYNINFTSLAYLDELKNLYPLTNLFLEKYMKKNNIVFNFVGKFDEDVINQENKNIIDNIDYFKSYAIETGNIGLFVKYSDKKIVFYLALPFKEDINYLKELFHTKYS